MDNSVPRVRSIGSRYSHHFVIIYSYVLVMFYVEYKIQESLALWRSLALLRLYLFT